VNSEENMSEAEKENPQERVHRLTNELQEALLAELEEYVEDPDGSEHDTFPDAPFGASLMIGSEPETEADCHSQAQVDELRKHDGKLVRILLTMSNVEAKSLRAALDLQIKKSETVQVYVSGDLGAIYAVERDE
jgi:hypothetical protein